MRTTTINIIGNGSIGHLWAAHFYDCKISFNLYGRIAKPVEIYQLSSPNKNFSYQTSVISIDDFRPADLTIICVKAFSLDLVCKRISGSLHSSQIILLMMNGMGLIEIAEKSLVSASIYHASITHGANLSGMLLEHTGTGTTLIGDLEPQYSNTHSKIHSLIPILNQALPNTSWNESQKASLWEKLFINSIINPLTAYYRVENGLINSDSKICAHATRLCKELAPIIKHYLPSKNWQQVFDDVISVSRQTSNNRSSMLRDVEANRQTEIKFITGYLLDKAAQIGCELSAHNQLYVQMRTIRDNCPQ